MKKNTLLFVLLFAVQCFSAIASTVKPPAAGRNLYAPANDNCSGAIALAVNAFESCTTGSSTTTVSFTQATSSGVPALSCANVATAPLDIWYQFTATATCHAISLWAVTPSTPATFNQEIAMGVYSGDCTSLTAIACSTVNYLKVYNLVPGQVYKLRLYFNVASPSLTPTFGICVSTPTIPATCENVCVNGSFEDRTFTGTGNADLNQYAIQGWRTLADQGAVEYWPSNATLINPPAAAVDGVGIDELCSNGNGEQTIYQQYSTPYPTTFTIDFYHRAREISGTILTDEMELVAGPPGGPYTRIGYFETGTAWVHYGDGVVNPVITYTSPMGQATTRIMFRSTATARQKNNNQQFASSTGNLIDKVSIYLQNSIHTPNNTVMNCGASSVNVQAVGFGTWTQHASNPGTVTFANPGLPVTTISGFTVPGTYTFDWGRANCMSTVSIIYYGPDPTEPVAVNPTYCQGETALPLSATASTGNRLIWYDPDGNEYDGTTPTPSTATIGTSTYYVIQRSPNDCDSLPTEVTVTITSGGTSVTDFTLPAAVCQSAGAVTPVQATGFSTGGTYTATPAGLTINATTGEITPSTSTPGTYQVTYNYVGVGSCVQSGSSTQPITIDAAPALVNTTPLQLCDDNYDGIAVFDITAAGTEASNGLANLTLTYYDNLTDANAGNTTGVISTPATYSNTTPNTQTVYVRAVEQGNTTNCYSVKAINLVVNPRPAVPVVSTYTLCDDPATTGNVATFDLTTKDTEANGGVTGLTVTYYETQTAAESGGTSTITTPATYNNTSTPQTIWVRVQNSFGCYSVGSFTLVVNPLPTVNTAVSDYLLCDDGTGNATFTLSTKNNEVTNNTSGYTVTYYATQTEAQTGVGTPLSDSYYTNNTTVYARVETAAGCAAVTSVTLRALGSPTLSPVTPLEACAQGTGNTATFNLVPSANEAIGGVSGYQFTYYDTLANANNGGTTGQINAPGTYVGTTGTVYIRIQPSGTTTGCYSVAPVSITVHPIPAVPTVSDYAQCDDASGDGVETFNLSSKVSEITTNATDVVTFYTSSADAQLGNAPITTPGAYQNTTPGRQEIFFRLESQYGCASVGSFFIIVNPLPNANLTSPVFAACEEVPGQGLFDLNDITPVITNGQAGYSVAYYANLADVGVATPLSTTTDYLSPDATIYALLTDVVTGCSIVAPAVLDVQSAPIIPSVPVLEACDFNNDMVAPFYLQQIIDDMIAYFGTGVTVSLHETQEDADFQNGTNPITNLVDYTNVNAATTNGVQIIYVRVANAAGCYDVSQVQLIAHPVPEATDPLEAFHVCDNGTSDTDGVAIFDLTTYNSTVLNTINPANFTVTYHVTRAEAEAGTPAISSPATYQSATGSVFVRVTNNATQCYDIVELELVVDPLPVAVQPTAYTLCDVTNPGDEIEQFDLTTKIPEITAGALGVNVTFYHTYADAVAGTSAITNPTTYTNTIRNGVESIFVKVSDADTGCYRIVLLDVRVAPLPVLTQPSAADLTVCDTDGSGYGSFDLTSLEDIMINNGVNLTLSFYHTSYDAEHNLNAIPNPATYTNINPGVQFVYVVATDNTSGCRSAVYPITLTVAPAPRAVRLQDLTDCDDQDNNGQDNQLVFDLTTQNTVIETQLGVAAGTYIINYFTTEVNAEAGSPRITSPQTFLATADGQEVWVRIENRTTGCYQVTSFKLHINQPQLLAPASEYVKCNDGAINTQTAVFDLTTKDDYILTPYGIGEGNVVEYFVSAAAMAANNPITTPEAFTNTVNPQDIYVRVTTPQGCTSTTMLLLRVLPQPTPNTNPEPLELCDTQANGYGFEEFDLSLASRRILANDSRSVISYYETEADALAGTNAIPTVVNTAGVTTTPYINTTAWSQIVYARVALAGSQVADPSCVQVVEQELVVNPLPPVYDPATGDIKDYAICSPNSTGTETFHLMDFVRGLLTDAGVNPNDYQVRFYYDMAAYTAGTALPHVYTNTTPNQQTIVVYVQNTVTGCQILANMTLYAEQAAVANAAAQNPWIVCDDDGTNDGQHLFDLTTQDASILGTQNTGMFRVEYYTTQAAALAADTTAPEYISPADAAAYVNTSNPQTIWATVKNYLSHAPCIDVTSFDIGVELLGEPEIYTDGDNHTLCMVYNGGAIDPLPLKVNLAVGSYTFTWYLDGREIATDLVSNVYNATEPGFYSVVATSTSALHCVSDVSAEFEVIQSGPAQAVNANQPYAISMAFSDNQTITVLAEGYGEYQYSLGPDGPWQNSNVFENVPLGYFDIYVRDTKTDNPCSDYVITGVSIIDYPKFFTPNGDGYNDYWNIQGMTHNGYEDARIYIFDRYGKLIKQLNPLSRTDEGEGWDGTYNGKELPSDDYWFLVEFTENGQKREFRAHFAMKR